MNKPLKNMMNLNQKLTFPSVLILIFSFSSARVSADFYLASISGSIETGTFNEMDLAGSSFSFNAVISNSSDQAKDLDVGIYLAEQAWFDFGALGIYEADPNDLGFVIVQQAALFQLGFASDTESIIDSIRYIEVLNQGDPPFDPNVLIEIPLVTSFNGFGSNGLFSTTNSDGDSLVIERLANPNSASARVVFVPEPAMTLFPYMLAIFLNFRRKREST